MSRKAGIKKDKRVEGLTPVAIRAMKGRKVGLLMGGRSREREISLRSGSCVLKALRSLGYKVTPIDCGSDLPVILKRRKVEVAFIALHGEFGEDGSVQGLLDLMGIPYTGSGLLSSAISMDKGIAKTVLEGEGVRTPRYYVDRGASKGGAEGGKVKYPLIVKPIAEGSTIGIRVVRKRADLESALRYARRYGGGRGPAKDKDILVEEFIEGREVTVSIIEETVLPVVEINPKSEIYDFNAKYVKGSTDFTVPAPLSKGVEAKVREAALQSYRALRCRGAARVDIMLSKGGTPYVLEVNTVPGMTDLSLLPMAAMAAGIDYGTLVELMLLKARCN